MAKPVFVVCLAMLKLNSVAPSFHKKCQAHKPTLLLILRRLLSKCIL